MKIFREEFFGGILYDDSRFNYSLITENREDIKAYRIIPLPGPAKRTDILSAPVRVYFEFTRKCNLACRHCFTSSSPSSGDGMSTSVVYSLLEDIKKARIINIRFTGGEPTIRPDWYEVLSYAKSLGLIVALSSNGVYAEPDKTIDRIVDLEPEQVTVSIDGMEKSHDYLRGRGTFKKSLYTLERLKEAGSNVRMTTVLTKFNLKEIPEILALADKYVKAINFVFMRFIGRGRYDYGITFEEHYESGLKVAELQEKYPRLLILHSAKPLPRGFAVPMAPSGLTFSSAFANTSLNVAADGTVWPHHYLAHQNYEACNIGKFPENSLIDIWQNSKKMDHFRSRSEKLMERCFKCEEFRKRCAGYNFEMEVAVLKGDIEKNIYCINEEAHLK